MYSPFPSTANEPERTLVACGALDESRLAAQDRLVDPERVCPLERAVGDDLVAGADLNEIAGDEPVDENLPRSAVAHDGRRRDDQRRQPVERPLGTDLLPAPDPGVGDEHPRKSASCHWPNASVMPPATARIRLKRVKTFARTMLA